MFLLYWDQNKIVSAKQFCLAELISCCFDRTNSINSFAGYGYSRTGVAPLCTSPCALDRGAAYAHMC